MELRVGLCSFKGLNRHQRTRVLLEPFSALEMGSSFYALPSPEQVFRWAAELPKGFLLGVKALGLFTFHPVRPSSLPGWARPPGATEAVMRHMVHPKVRRALYRWFLERLEPLRETGKLGYLLFQFHPSFEPSQEALAYLAAVRDMSPSWPLAVEVRNDRWLSETWFAPLTEALRDQNAAFVGTDSPGSKDEILWPRTASWGVLARFHGRGGSPRSRRIPPPDVRGDYLYTPQDLRPWRERALLHGSQGGRVFLMFNNCVADKALKSASLMASLLGLKDPDSRQQELGI
ncbi:hypothetical protein TheveDRAFT_0493 [Thermanaerovibrio velox DSM 12556]|uniref:DUF72 domain-containing protein n=1 Tax=Thermanaerovibrio velox DSM 12556 TaxID=926567 RepID=H0UQ25_9BACT|nr:DUF72 domain-containing protein [Thermanaerovibrio velox]EHM09654.1 hypothetical protein TheveDRAFT_0493 [Thermanaerovibrio velox DSM 12556]